MNRRKFLKYTGLTLVACAVPLTVSAKPTVSEDDPSTVEELIAAMEKRFVCSVGYPGPYVFEVPQNNNLTVPLKYQYITYGLKGWKDNPKTKEALVRSLWATFRQYPEGARMYWRLDYKISMEDEPEMARDGWTPTGEWITKIRTRVAFPENYKG